jgi:phospholipase C
MHPLRTVVFSVFLAINVPALGASPPERRPELDRIGHIIVVFLENRSFDHLYGLFPGAEGIQDSGFASIQVSAEGRQFATLPAVTNNLAQLGGIDARFAAGLPNGPFRADRYVNLEERTSDPVHRFYQEQEQIDGGKMDRFVAVSDTGALPMGYFDGRALPLFSLAREYTLADRFFHAAFGGALPLLADLRMHAALRRRAGKSGSEARWRWADDRGWGGNARRIRRQHDRSDIRAA